MEPAEYTLVLVNLLAGFGCAIPIGRLLSRVDREPRRVLCYSAVLVGAYSVECIALVMGMGIPVFSVGLALVWGIVFGLWLRGRTPIDEVLKTSFFLSLYSSLPAASFISVPVVTWVGGWSVLSAQEGARFGIPGFLPWPLSTILGFYVTLAIAAVLLKTVITVGEASALSGRYG